MRKYIDIINESQSGSFFGGNAVIVHGGPAYNPVVSHSPRMFVLYDDNGVEQASILKTMAQAPGAKFSSFTDQGASSHEEFSEAMAAAKAAIGLEGEVEVVKWIDLSPDDKNIILANNTYADEELEEGWKAALGAAAMGAAALAGASGMGSSAATPQPNTQLSSIQPMKFSPEAEKAAKQAGYQSAEAMYYFMKQQSKGATVEVDAFDRALADAKGASIMQPGNLLGYVADKMNKATNKR